MEQLNAKFSELKKLFNSQESNIQELLSNQDKNEKLLSAFKNELQEIQAGAQQKQEIGANITADEYVSLKNQFNDLKARIEYHNAIQEDIENEIYQGKETLSKIKSEMNTVRAEICEKIGLQKLAEFLTTQKTALDEIFSYIYLSNKFQDLDIYFFDKEKYTKEFISSEIIKKITKSPIIPQELKTHSPLLDDFKVKTPTQKHREQFEYNPEKRDYIKVTKENGLKSLLNEIAGA